MLAGHGARNTLALALVPHWDPAGPAWIWAALSIKHFDFHFKETDVVPTRLLLSVGLSKVCSFAPSRLFLLFATSPHLGFSPYERSTFSNRHLLLVLPLKPNPLAVLRELERTWSRCSLQSGC